MKTIEEILYILIGLIIGTIIAAIIDHLTKKYWRKNDKR